MTRLVLVRHGQARAAVDGVAGGARGCQGLTELGRAQVEALARRLAGSGEQGRVSVLMSSTLPRAIETAERLAPALGGLPVRAEADLSELDPGEGDGLTWAEWEQRYGSFDVAAEPYRALSPGGESWAAFGLRAGRALDRIARANGDGVVVVACHGGIIEQSIAVGLGLPSQKPLGSRIETPPNASLTEWRVDHLPGGELHWRLIRFADAAHLAGLPAR